MKTILPLFIAVTGVTLCAQAVPPAKTTTVPGKPVNVRPVVAPQPAANPGTGIILPTTTIPVTWTGTATGTGGMGATDPTAGTPTSGEGFNQDTFVLTVGAGDFTGKSVSVTISWTIPVDDYDLYIFKRNADGTNGAAVGSSATGAPGTSESVSFSPTSTGAGAYNVIAVYFTTGVGPANTDQYRGSASIIAAPVARTATYIKGGITFSPNTPVKTPTAAADGEPSSRVDAFGNYYVCGIRGVPAGVDLWYFDLRPTVNGVANPAYDPNMRVPFYRGMPDAVIPGEVSGTAVAAGGLGGGDIDLAVGFGNYTGLGASTTAPQPVLAYASLTAANVTVGNSLDLGKTFVFNAAGNALGGVPVNDRQWMGAFGNNTIYLEYRNFAEGIAFVQQSVDGGATYGAAVPVGTIPQTGALDVDQFDGTVYISGNDGSVAMGTPLTPTTFPVSYTKTQATPLGVNPANIFFPIRVAGDQRNAAGTLIRNGTVYGVYSDGHGIFLVSSADKGQTWSAPVQVNDPTDAATRTNLLPWLATGPTPGSLGVVWYGSDSATNDDSARWRVYYAQSFDANSAAPTFRMFQASDHSNHAANALSGLSVTGQSPNRNLIDYFQINFDPTGAAVIGYTDDHSDFSGNVYVTRQISGPSINNKTVTIPTPVEGSALPAVSTTQPAQPGPNGEQVTDFPMDQDSGLVAVTPTTSPIDILSVLYTSQDSNQGPVITATMTVSNLSTVPPSSTWTMYFTANAPETGLVTIAGNQYSKGLSDRGDQFYVQFATSASGARTGTWGTVVRNFDGSLTTASQGTADRVFVNQQANTLSVRLSSSKLNTYLTNIGHATVGFGSTFCGLRTDGGHGRRRGSRRRHAWRHGVHHSKSLLRISPHLITRFIKPVGLAAVPATLFLLNGTPLRAQSPGDSPVPSPVARATPGAQSPGTASLEERIAAARSVKVMTSILGIELGSDLDEAHEKLDKLCAPGTRPKEEGENSEDQEKKGEEQEKGEKKEKAGEEHEQQERKPKLGEEEDEGHKVLWQLAGTDYSAIYITADDQEHIDSITGFLRPENQKPFDAVGEVSKAPVKDENSVVWDVLRTGHPLFRVVAKGTKGKASSIRLFVVRRKSGEAIPYTGTGAGKSP